MVNPAVYANRKRSRPIPKLKPGSPKTAKTNASKRHRDKLNVELDRVAALLPLPEHVSSKLDKLSVMRLTVGYLRAKSLLSNTLQKSQTGHSPNSQQGTEPPTTGVPEGELMLQALNGFVLVVTGDGTVFYTSHNIQDHLGYYQSDVINQTIFKLIHTEDRVEFDRQLMLDLPVDPGDQGSCGGLPAQFAPDHPSLKTQSCVDRSFVCRMRCLLDCVSGFLTLQVQGKLRPLQEFGDQAAGGQENPAQIALFAIAVPVHLPAIVEIRTRNLNFRTKHELDFRPIEMDNKGKTILGWNETELKSQTGYFYIHFEDLVYCAEGHIKLMKTGSSGVTVFRLLTKNYTWVWISAIARIIYKDGKPNFILATQRPLTDAEGEEHLLKRAKLECFPTDSQSLLYDSTDFLHPDARAFLQQVEHQCRARGHLHSNVVGDSMSQDNPPYIYRPPEGPCPQPWPHFPAEVSIWELLWRYGLCQEDLDAILQDEAIAQVQAFDAPEDLLNFVLQGALPSSQAQLPGASQRQGSCPEPAVEASYPRKPTQGGDRLPDLCTSLALSPALHADLFHSGSLAPLTDPSSTERLLTALSEALAQQSCPPPSSSSSSSSFQQPAWPLTPPGRLTSRRSPLAS